MTEYDSKAEASFHANFPHLKSARNEFYKQAFSDSSGDVFRAKPDFYCERTATYIELKAHQLNTKRTRGESHQAEGAIFRFKGYIPLIDKLKHSWNHSIYKQLAVQQTLAKYGIKMIVVFKEGVKLSTQSINKMNSLGLVWMREEDYCLTTSSPHSSAG